MNRVKDEGLEELTKIKKIKVSMETNETPEEYNWFKLVVYTGVVFIAIWTFVNYQTNLSM